MIHRHGVVRGSARRHPLHHIEGGHGIVHPPVIASSDQARIDIETQDDRSVRGETLKNDTHGYDNGRKKNAVPPLKSLEYGEDGTT